MMTSDEIKSLVLTGEGYQAEWKERIPSKVKDITEEICAFANAAGGTVLIGVDDNNNITGGLFPNGKRSAIQNSIGEITPPLHVSMSIVDVDGKDIMVLEVPSGKQKPYVLSGAIYVRHGPNTKKLNTVEEMRDFFQQSDRIFFDESPVQEFDINEELASEFFGFFRSEAGLSATISRDQILKNLKLFTDDGFFKIGAVLFFGKAPESYVEKAVIRCVSFDGFDKRIINDSKDFIGPLHLQYTQSLQWLKNKLDVKYDIESEGTGPRREIWEIPPTVFREVIINALSHRDYYDKGGRITIELFKDRVEISNPGGLISGIVPSEFGKRSLSRNPLIFGLFERMKLVEQIGSGISRIRDLMVASGLAEPAFHLEGMFAVTLKRRVEFNAWIREWGQELTDNRKNILKAIHEDNTISKKEIAKRVGIGDTTVDKNIEWLRNNNFIDRTGSARTGHWRILYKRKVGR